MKVDIHVKINVMPEELEALKEKNEMLMSIVNRIMDQVEAEVASKTSEANEEQEHCSNEDFMNYLKIRDEEPWKIFGITEEKYNAYKKMYGRLSNADSPKVGESAQWITAKTCNTLHEFIRVAEDYSFSFF